MNLDNMRVAIRPLSTHQAIDLGFMMARRWFLPLWQIWLAVSFPIFVILFFVTLLSQMYLSDVAYISSICAFVLWWFKPIFEKNLVNWLGIALFEEKVPVKKIIIDGYKSYHHHLVRLLFKRRLSFSRQILLPILVLEKPDNSIYAKRHSLLLRGQSSSISWMTLVLFHVEMIVISGIMIFLSMLIPKSFLNYETLMTLVEKMPVWTDALLLTLYYFVFSVVAPFFICGGFSIYLTKRCLLEGWDIELTFKNISKRYVTKKASPLESLSKKPLSNIGKG